MGRLNVGGCSKNGPVGNTDHADFSALTVASVVSSTDGLFHGGGWCKWSGCIINQIKIFTSERGKVST